MSYETILDDAKNQFIQGIIEEGFADLKGAKAGQNELDEFNNAAETLKVQILKIDSNLSSREQIQQIEKVNHNIRNFEQLIKNLLAQVRRNMA